jgi:metallo-beta-lactamase class B
MKTTARVMTFAASCLMAAALGFGFEAGAPAAAQTGAEPYSKVCREGPRSREVEIQKIEPFKMFDNLYHVGPCYVAVYLLTTPAGHVLFDSTQEPFVDHTIANIQKVGINLRDIKYIVLAHGHLDHVGGAAKLQEATGARVMAAANDWTMIEALQGKTGNRDPRPNVMPKRDMVMKDGDALKIGDQDIRFIVTPGHTPGVLSAYNITLRDGSSTYKAFWGGGGGGGEGLKGAEEGVINTKKIADIQGIQVNLMPHSWAPPNGYPGGGIHERAMLLKTRKAGDPNPFVDAGTWNARAKRTYDNETKRLAEEKAKAGTK